MKRKDDVFVGAVENRISPILPSSAHRLNACAKPCAS
jgi:hypothetical protein